MSLIFIDRTKIYDVAVDAVKTKDDSKLKDAIKMQLVTEVDEEEGYIVLFNEFKKIEKAIEAVNETWIHFDRKMSYNDFIEDITKMVTKSILKDFEYLLKVATNTNKYGHLYLTDEQIENEPDNSYSSKGSGRVILQGFDWSYCEDKEYNYSFNIYITL